MNKLILQTVDDILANAQLVCQRNGYSVATLRILMALYREAPLCVTELASIVSVTQQAVGKTLRKLEAKGLIVSNKDASDGRAKLIDLTSKGNKAVSTIESVWR